MKTGENRCTIVYYTVLYRAVKIEAYKNLVEVFSISVSTSGERDHAKLKFKTQLFMLDNTQFSTLICPSCQCTNMESAEAFTPCLLCHE